MTVSETGTKIDEQTKRVGFKDGDSGGYVEGVALVGDGTGTTNMNVKVTDTGTDGACADHVAPTHTFTAASGAFTGLENQQIEVTDTGAGGNGVLGIYTIDSVNSATSVELTEDPTNGVNETGMDWEVKTAKFLVEAHADYDIRIMKIIVFIGDGSVTHGGFGGVGALTNGIELHTNESGVKTKIIDAAKTGGEVIIQSATSLAWGDAATSFELTNYTSGNDDATVVIIPIGEIVPLGLRIGRGTKDHIMMMVKDDLTGLITFNCRVLGYRHYP